MSDEEEVITFKLTENDLRLIVYWRERCNQCHGKNFTCPLYCIKEGTDFCHKLGSQFSDSFDRLRKKKALIEYKKENPNLE